MSQQSVRQSLAPLATSAMAIVLALLAGSVFLIITGKNPLQAYAILFGRGLGSPLALQEIVIKMAPLLIISAGLLVTLKAGVWNIGIDGQFLIGALAAGVVAAWLGRVVPPALVWLGSAVAGFTCGALWGLIPALLKVRYGLNEIITTIMMNYVALYTTSWLVKGPFKDPTVVPPQTPVIPQELRLPAIPPTRIHIGIIVGLLALLAAGLLYRYLTTGFKLWTFGHNKKAAIHAGMPVGWLVGLALMISAGCAGLAGSNDVLGVKGLFQGEWNPGYGLTGFALVFLARLSPLWVVAFAFFFSFLLYGGELMARSAGIPTYFVELLEGLMLLFFAISVWLERTLVVRQLRAQSVHALEAEKAS